MNKTDTSDPLIFVATSDVSGLVRGKSFPQSEWDKRVKRGIGWTPTNVQITCFDSIAETPFGSLGDLALVPDASTRFEIAACKERPKAQIALGDIQSLEGEPWEFCTRSIAKRAIDRLSEVGGVEVNSAFEHEFQLTDLPIKLGDGFGFKGFRESQIWAEHLISVLRECGCQPDTFMKEYGPSQFELTNHPAKGLASPDIATKLRLIINDVIPNFGYTPSFSPILDPNSVGNGVHIHFSFLNEAGEPVTYDANDPYGMSKTTRHFIGGILKYLENILCLLAPSEISYLRLTPHRWSAAFNNLGYRDREASVRICPVSSTSAEAIAKQYNFEVRAVDAAASPYLAFAALVFAGAQGIQDEIEPPKVTEEDLSLLSEQDLHARGFKRLPQSLEEALTAFEQSDMVKTWFGENFVKLYRDHKIAELSYLKDKDWNEKCDLYKQVY